MMENPPIAVNLFPPAAMPQKSPFHENYHSTSALSSGGSPSPAGDGSATVPASWMESFATKFYSCAGCGNLLQEPVIVRETNVFACRTCAAHLEADEVSQPPVAFVQGLQEMKAILLQLAKARTAAVGGSPLPASSSLQAAGATSGRRIVKVKRTKVPTPSAGETTKAIFQVFPPHDKDSEPQFASSPPPPPSPFSEPLMHGLNPNVELSGQKHNTTPQKGATVKAPPVVMSSPPRSQSADRPFVPPSAAEHTYVAPADENDSAQRKYDVHQDVEAFLAEQRVRRDELFDMAKGFFEELTITEALEHMDITKKQKSEFRAIVGKSKNSSRSLKTQADESYETSQYPVAIDLYTKAIAAYRVDGMAKLPTLYGNRSAAFYMAGRYKESIDDCIKVLELEPETVKMYQRAAKASVSLGDLDGALNFFSKIPSDKMTAAYNAEKAKLEEGKSMLTKAQQLFGNPEGDEQWLMLVALYSETGAFRLRCAEHLAHQKSFARAIETLSVLVGPARTSEVSAALARYMYLSGFEHFDRARSVLEPHRDVKDCAQLLHTIRVVDDGKQQGNILFSQKKFAEAVDYYTKAIDAAKNNDQILRILHCNRAAAFKELGRYKEGVEDCTKAIRVDAQFTKAYARRARCHQLLGDHHAAIRDFKNACKYDPSDADLAEELRRAETLLAEESKKEKDFYYVLGVQRNATDDQIRAKYKELALRWHPDKCMHLEADEKVAAEHKFKTIGHAYQTLVDAVKRREYDLKQERERLTKTSSYSNFFSGATGATGPTAPPYPGGRYTSGMPERRAQNFW